MSTNSAFDVVKRACYEKRLGAEHSVPILPDWVWPEKTQQSTSTASLSRSESPLTGQDRDPKRARLHFDRFGIEPTVPNAHLTPSPPKRTIRIPRRKVLPMLLGNHKSPVNVIACPDTGSEHNIISAEAAKLLGCRIEPPTDSDDKFCVANGQEVGAVGRVVTDWSFAAGAGWDGPALECVFHVFSTLAVPVIMGLHFLELTETYTKHKNRLIDEPFPAAPAIRVNSVGRPKRDLVCRLDGYVGLANVDTGSDLDFVSDKYARARGFSIEEAYHEVMFADGSTGVTCGVFRVSFAVGQVPDEASPFVARSEPIEIEFFILENLSSDILIGQTTIEELDVFNAHPDSFIASSPRLGESDVNIIRYIGKAEKLMTGMLAKFNRNSQKKGAETETDNAQRWALEDQRENARREAATVRIMGLTGDAKARAQADEGERIARYQRKRSQRKLQDSDAVSVSSLALDIPSPRSDTDTDTIDSPPYYGINEHEYMYICPHSGCNVAPFLTQYLLNSHLNSHSSARPHHCPVSGCPRAEGGKGFKRRNEMMRHRLIHDAPGYICPFCPEPDHKYPRPDNLQRHVRVHHIDKDLDDPLLLDVLAQRHARWAE
ncbi:hypothetical protein QBC43DRAFT_323465 [Cladorrhinum sp. PSN259]|nr:hypothetical protein QBC43DRAFT_323465 [Cladorrhinum sp. PSN259]